MVMNEKKIVLIVAYEGYHHIEYNETKKNLEQHHIKVITASDKMGFALALNGSTTCVHILLKNIDAKDYDGIFFIGGPGTLEHLDNDISYRVAQKAMQSRLLFGAICIATRILAYAGVLAHRKATGWDGDKQLAKIYKEYDAHLVPEPVVVDGSCITAQDPHASQDFAHAIANALLN